LPVVLPAVGINAGKLTAKSLLLLLLLLIALPALLVLLARLLRLCLPCSFLFTASSKVLQ
jgi:hypothetical protein